MVRGMRKLHSSFSSLLAALVLVAALIAAPGVANAEHGTEHGIGVGVAQTLAGISGATFVYDASSFHIVGLLGFQSIDRDPANDSSAFALGGQFLFHVSTTAQSDFSLGGGLTIVEVNNDPGLDDETNIDLEGLAQIRAFIVPNVALSASLGLLIATANDVTILGDGAIVGEGGKNSIGLGGQVVGNFGLTYFF
jgi:hypothetical protein